MADWGWYSQVSGKLSPRLREMFYELHRLNFNDKWAKELLVAAFEKESKKVSWVPYVFIDMVLWTMIGYLLSGVVYSFAFLSLSGFDLTTWEIEGRAALVLIMPVSAVGVFGMSDGEWSISGRLASSFRTWRMKRALNNPNRSLEEELERFEALSRKLRGTFEKAKPSVQGRKRVEQ